jgi:hypothetical protein
MSARIQFLRICAAVDQVRRDRADPFMFEEKYRERLAVDECINIEKTPAARRRFERTLFYQRQLLEEERARMRSGQRSVSSSILVWRVILNDTEAVYCEYPNRLWREMFKFLRKEKKWPMSARVQLLRIFAAVVQVKRDRAALKLAHLV